MTATISTAGRHSRFNVYEHLAAAYQDSGLLAQLMCGNLDAPERMPAGGVRMDESWTYGQRAVAMTHVRDDQLKRYQNSPAYPVTHSSQEPK